MKNLRQLCAALVLTLTFILSAYAEDGHVSCPGIASPSPAPTAEGQIETTFTESILLTLETGFLLA